MPSDLIATDAIWIIPNLGLSSAASICAQKDEPIFSLSLRFGNPDCFGGAASVSIVPAMKISWPLNGNPAAKLYTGRR